jgi:hypothetical protein
MRPIIEAIEAEIQLVHDLANPPCSGAVLDTVNAALTVLYRLLALAQAEQAKIASLT